MSHYKPHSQVGGLLLFYHVLPTSLGIFQPSISLWGQPGAYPPAPARGAEWLLSWSDISFGFHQLGVPQIVAGFIEFYEWFIVICSLEQWTIVDNSYGGFLWWRIRTSEEWDTSSYYQHVETIHLELLNFGKAPSPQCRLRIPVHQLRAGRAAGLMAEPLLEMRQIDACK